MTPDTARPAIRARRAARAVARARPAQATTELLRFATEVCARRPWRPLAVRARAAAVVTPRATAEGASPSPLAVRVEARARLAQARTQHAPTAIERSARLRRRAPCPPAPPAFPFTSRPAARPTTRAGARSCFQLPMQAYASDGRPRPS